MNSEKIRAEIEFLRKITGDWNDNIPEMERDIVLDLLRRLYAEIKYQGHDNERISVSARGVRNDTITESDPETTAPQAAMQQQETAQQESAEPDQKPCESENTDESSVQQDTCGKYAAPDMADSMPSAQDRTDETDGPAAAASDQTLPGQTTAIKRPVSRNIIRSLYGDPVGTPSATPEYNTPRSEPAHETGISANTDIDTDPAAAADAGAATELHTQTNQTKVLGEVLGQAIKQGPTLGDALQNASGKDIASKIASADTKSIRGALGINDRFLMIRDLFGGNSEAFDSAVARLEEFSSLEEALLYINDNFDWNPDSEGAKMLVELLVRKLS